jgi:hypothetical protein
VRSYIFCPQQILVLEYAVAYLVAQVYKDLLSYLVQMLRNAARVVDGDSKIQILIQRWYSTQVVKVSQFVVPFYQEHS